MQPSKGSIPMTAYNFDQHNSAHLMHIGTAGGDQSEYRLYLSKSQEKINELIEFSKGKALNNSQRNKFSFTICCF